MKAKEIIELNNEKRELLNEENVDDYEDMLTYIRLASSKSEQQTEEILMELLDHVLLAQEEGKTVRDVFGTDLKAYCQDVIEEIPEETKKKQLRFSTRLIFLFLAVASLSSGIVNSALYYLFDFGERVSTLYVGTSIGIIVINTLIAFGTIYFILEWLKASTFQEKKKSAWKEFFQLWIIMTLVIGLFIAVLYFMPSFGAEFSLPNYMYIPIGIVLYGISYVLKE